MTRMKLEALNREQGEARPEPSRTSRNDPNGQTDIIPGLLAMLEGNTEQEWGSSSIHNPASTW